MSAQLLAALVGFGGGLIVVGVGKVARRREDRVREDYRQRVNAQTREDVRAFEAWYRNRLINVEGESAGEIIEKLLEGV